MVEEAQTHVAHCNGAEEATAGAARRLPAREYLKPEILLRSNCKNEILGNELVVFQNKRAIYQ
jgi:hypothetical protein